MTLLGVIGGTGWLGRAMLLPALEQGILDPAALWISSRTDKGRDAFARWPQIRFTADNRALAARSDVVLLSVRPEDGDGLDLDLPGKLLLSVMAMVDAGELAGRFSSQRIVRAMPNACAEIGLSFTPLLFSHACTAADRDFATRLFAASGEVVEVKSERELACLTGLTGSGPAYLAAFADAMLAAATRLGLAPELADRAVRQLFLGGSTLLARDPRPPAGIVEIFKAYRGTTAAGLQAMADMGLADAIDAGLTAAARKALGRQDR
nr:pyrroline-5-carboxylate reductase dimerization domain-containing protein [uncultured Gellertiella sp.]